MKKLFLLLVLFGCARIVPVSHNVEKRDSVIIREKLVPIEVPGSAVSVSLNGSQLDSLRSALKAMPSATRTIVMTDKSGATRLKFSLDSLGSLIIDCQTLRREFEAKLMEKDRYYLERERTIEKEKKSLIDRIESGFTNVLWLVAIAFGLVVLVNFILHRIR